MNRETYHALRRDSMERWSDEIPETPHKQLSCWPRTLSWIFTTSLAFLLAISLTANMVFICRGQPLSIPQASDGASQFGTNSCLSALKREIPIQIYSSTEYTADNLTTASDVWERLSGDLGVVALSQDYVNEQRLPHALRFPWDEDKGVYLLQGFHHLHCLRTLFRYIMYTEQGVPQRIALVHALHCLDQLRQDVICNADDTPRYAGFQNPPGTGAGQVRMCKDWGQLEKWALEHTACFKHEDEVPRPMIERFKSCPDGRVLWPTETGTAAAGGT
ncbi:hypothetical protein F5X99DRAFT_415765 [Biscogniauxia marginata]|nr:hypothetical protein F5X99DRAFT_415765 [Biscogniauxia marginata]